MRNKPVIFFAVILFVAGVWFLAHRSMVSEADPQIEAAVRQEIKSLASGQESLRSLHLGTLMRTYVVGRGVSLSGYFQFSGLYENQSCPVFVTWRQADTNAPIDKIEIGSTAKEPRMIWARK